MFTMNTESNMMARISAIAFALFCGAFLAAEAGEIHVDAAASPDGADGTQERPYATIQDAVDNAKEGDTIKVAAGIYDRGMRQVSGISYARVHVSGKPNLKIVGAGRGRSFIVGSRDPDAIVADDKLTSTHTNVIKCVNVSNSKGTVISGFTLKDGEAINGDTVIVDESYKALYGEAPTTGNRNGGGFCSDSLDVFIVDCDILHCTSRSGAGIYKGTAVRCRIDGNYGLTSVAAREARLFNCIVTRNTSSSSSSYGAINQSSAYNCTLFDNNAGSAFFSSKGHNGCVIKNCIVALSGTEVKASADAKSHEVANCVFASSATRGYAQFIAPMVDDYRLISNADAVGAALIGHLEVKLPDGVDIDLMKDINGETIVAVDEGKINAGAIQATATPAGGALAFPAGTYVIDGYTNVVKELAYLYPEIYPTQYCMRVVLNDGEELCRLERYNPTTGEIDLANYPSMVPQLDGKMWLMPPLSANTILTNKAVNADTVVWVDKNNGSDDWGDGVTDAGSAAHPYATIQKAVDVGISKNTVIKVLLGNYDTGVTTNETYGTFRLNVNSENVRIVAVNGPAETTISGAPDPLTEDNGTLDAGLGTNAVKCAYLRGKNVFLQGFTLANGYTDGSEASSKFRSGSAVVSDATSLSKDVVPFVVDCVISNCRSHAHGVFSAKLFRTRFADCVTCNEALIGSSLMWGCYGSGCTITCGNTTGYANDNSIIWQSTFVGAVKDGKVCSVGNVSYNSIWDGGVYAGTKCVFTNGIVYNVKNYYAETGYEKIDPLFVSRETDGVLRSDSPAVGLGDSLMECDYAEQFWRVATGDINGEKLVFTDGKCTVGAFQTVSNVVKVAVPNSQTGGWALAGEAQYGENLLYENGGSLTIVPTAGKRPCVGVTLAGRNYLFTNHPNETITFDYASLSGFEGELTISGIYTSDWYVDDDGDDSNTGFLPTCPKRTLATAAALLQAGDTLWVFPGTYDQGDGNHSSNCSKSRVVVKANTSVISLKGAEETIIKGEDASENKDEYGNGIGAVRCAHVGSNGLLKGFTLTGGRVDNTVSGESYRNGAAVFGASANSGSTVSDCIISNNVSFLGTIFKADVRNCVIIGNVTTDAGCALRKANAYNCYISGNKGKSVISLCGNIWATTVDGDNETLTGSEISLVASPETGSTMYNSLFIGKVSLNQTEAGSYCHMSNCVCATGSVFNDAAITGKVAVVDFAAQQFEERAIPVAGANAAVDAADESLCPGLYAETDLRGFQRKMNGRIDIGAYEADWRGRYASALCSANNALVVESASPEVVLAENELKIPSGGVEGWWHNATGKNVLCVIPVRVTGGGVLTVTLDGEELGLPSPGVLLGKQRAEV